MEYIQDAIQFLLVQLVAVITYPVSSNQRIYWLYLLTTAAVALFVYFRIKRTRQSPGAVSGGYADGSFLRFLFPKEIWRTKSAWLDVRYFFFHQIFRVVIYGAFLVGTLNLVYAGITLSADLPAVHERPIGTEIAGIVLAVLYMCVVLAAVDLVGYLTHYAQHKIPFLWEFHKVHHSLEVMHPLSNYREHPIDNIFYAGAIGATYGLIMGLTTNAFGYLPTMPQLLGVPLLFFAFNILGYNLRHSHIWFRWPGKWSMVFASPAHHQVHHSCHPDHLDKNFGFMLPVWDVLFGTYCMPETNKDVRFGLVEKPAYGYRSCLGLYVNPFRELLLRYRAKSEPSEAIHRSPDVERLRDRTAAEQS